MPTPVYRRPLGIVTANGALLPRVLGATCTRGWDQMIAQASVTTPYPPPAQLGIGAKVTIRGGIASTPLRFTGYVTGHGSELWPGTWTFPCQDVLWLAVHYHPTTTHDLSNKTDQAAWIYILTVMGLAFNPSLILGTGKKIGSAASAALTWGPDTSAFDMLRRIDEVSIVDHGGGHLTQFRGWVDFGGNIRRTEIANLPGATAARSFVEGIGIRDFVDGSVTVDHRENPHTSVTAIGDGVSSTVDDGGLNPWATIPNAGSFLYPMLQQTSGADLGTAAAAMFMLQKLGRNLVTVTFKTPRDDLMGAIETFLFDSDHHRLTLPVALQSVVFGWFPDGEMSQQVTGTSVRELNTNTANTGDTGSAIGPPTQFDPFDGSPIPPGDAVLVPVIPDSVIAAFNVAYIDVELVLIADVETLLYTAVCHDTSTASGGTIATRAWTTAGGATPATGSDVNFNPSWTNLTGASVTLTVTGSVGGSNAITIAISTSMGVPVRTRDLFAAATNALEAFRGSTRTWQRYATGITNAIVVANGPLWGDGDTVWRTEDYLDTPPLSSVPQAGKTVYSIWTELDLDADAVVASLHDGLLAFSSDAGATWVVKAGPDPTAIVLKVILSRFNPGQVQAITSTGYYLSTDAGDSWTLIRAGNYRDLDLNQFRSWAIEVTAGAGGMIEAASGSAITGAADNLVAVTSHILQDRGYALAADGSAYYLATDGATALTAGTAVPLGTGQHRGMYRDGSAPDILYAAVGAAVIKSTTGTRDAWWELRKPGVAGADAGSVYPMIGAGELASPPPVIVGLVVLVHTEGDGVMMRSLAGAWSRPSTTGAPRSGEIFSTAVSRDDTSRMYMAEGTDAPSPSASRFWASSDGGDTWTQKTSVPSLATWMESPTAGTIYAAGGKSGASTPGIYRSTDDGDSWTRILTDTSLNGLDCVSVTAGRIWFTSIHSPQTSYNAVRYCNLDGTGETQISGTNVTGPDILVRAWDDDLCLMVCFNASKVLKCVPGSAATDITPSGLGYTFQPFGVEPVSATTYLVYGDGDDGESHIVRSTDSGATWTDVFTSTGGHEMMVLGATDWQFLARLTATPSTVVALGYTATPYQQDVLISRDSGATWTVEKNSADEADGFGGYVMSAPGGLSAP